MSHLFAAKLDEFGLAEFAPLLELDEGAGHLPPLLVRHGDHRHLVHIGMAIEHVFHLQAGDVLPARDDDVLGSVLDLHITVRVPHRQIAAAKPPLRHRLGAGDRVLEIALHHHIAAQHDFAHGLAILRDSLAADRVDDPHLPLQR